MQYAHYFELKKKSLLIYVFGRLRKLCNQNTMQNSSRKDTLLNLLRATALSIQYCWEITFLLLKSFVFQARTTWVYLLYR